MYAAVLIDALHVKIRDGLVGPRPIYAAIGVDLGGGQRDVLGRWAGEGDDESAKCWSSVLTELEHRDAIAKAVKPITPQSTLRPARRLWMPSTPRGVRVIRRKFGCGATLGSSS